MMVLFLGGPWHDQRHEVTPRRMATPARSLPTHFTVAVTDAESQPPAGADSDHELPRTGGHVTYARRFARANGERMPVYVSPDYHGPARA